MGSSSIIAIDPGNDTGWAFYLNGMLHQCGLTKPDKLPPVRFAKLIVECPQVYPHGGKVDPNDLITLAIKVGRAMQFYEGHGCKVYQTFPRCWKGQVPKEIHHRRLYKELFANELANLERDLSKVATGLQHNVLDAVALGKWFAKAERVRP